MVLSCNVMCQTCSKCSAMQCNVIYNAMHCKVRWSTGHCLKPLICRHGQSWFSCETHFTASDHHGSTMAWYQQPPEKERQSQDKTHPWKSFQILRIIHPGWYNVCIFLLPSQQLPADQPILTTVDLPIFFREHVNFGDSFTILGSSPLRSVLSISLGMYQ